MLRVKFFHRMFEKWDSMIKKSKELSKNELIRALGWWLIGRAHWFTDEFLYIVFKNDRERTWIAEFFRRDKRLAMMVSLF